MPSSERDFKDTPSQAWKGALRTILSSVSKSTTVASPMHPSQVKFSHFRVTRQCRPFALIGIASQIEHIAAMGHGKCPRCVLLDHQDGDSGPVDGGHLLEHQVDEAWR